MPTEMEKDATLALGIIAQYGTDEKDSQRGRHMMLASQLKELTGLTPERLNDAMELLERNGYVELLRTLGSNPFSFKFATATPMGRFEFQRLESLRADSGTQPSPTQSQTVARHPLPVGSPFGFTDVDWEFVESERRRSTSVKVVFGLQYESESYETQKLIENVKKSFEEAVKEYNSERGHSPVTLNFMNLKAGYGEHLFNKIARDIISADIAVFETSDQNPNVMIEMGVALTWGIRVLPIKDEKRKNPPSDISGQTRAEYRESAERFMGADHLERLVRMIDLAIRKKVTQ
jgi:hypothetical protein